MLLQRRVCVRGVERMSADVGHTRGRMRELEGGTDSRDRAHWVVGVRDIEGGLVTG